MRECSIVINGLRFYVPDETPAEVLTLYERAEASGQPIELSESPDDADGLYLVTAAGERAIADCDMSGLAQLETDLKEIRNRRTGNGEISTRPDGRDETLPW